jgi:hypothetical protein
MRNHFAAKFREVVCAAGRTSATMRTTRRDQRARGPIRGNAHARLPGTSPQVVVLIRRRGAGAARACSSHDVIAGPAAQRRATRQSSASVPCRQADRCYAWNSIALAALLPFRRSRSETGVGRAVPGACGSFAAGASGAAGGALVSDSESDRRARRRLLGGSHGWRPDHHPACGENATEVGSPRSPAPARRAHVAPPIGLTVACSHHQRPRSDLVARARNARAGLWRAASCLHRLKSPGDCAWAPSVL